MRFLMRTLVVALAGWAAKRVAARVVTPKRSRAAVPSYKRYDR